jgi:hypothetical protein
MFILYLAGLDELKPWLRHFWHFATSHMWNLPILMIGNDIWMCTCILWILTSHSAWHLRALVDSLNSQDHSQMVSSVCVWLEHLGFSN